MNVNQNRLKKRVIQAAEEALYKKKYVSPIDVFIGMGWLQPIHVKDWRKGKIPYLERMIQGNLKKISFCMKCFRSWANEKGLIPNQTAYLARTSGPRRDLKFSASGNPTIEKSYRTHYISPILSEIKKKIIEEKLNAPSDLVVFRTVKGSKCIKCDKEIHKGCFLFLEAGEPLCLPCANLDDLVFLPRGNAKLTRLVNKESKKSAVVVEFSRSRKRYERQGLLVEKKVLEKVQKELEIDDEDDDKFDSIIQFEQNLKE